MLNRLDGYRRRIGRRYTADDLTMIVAIRAHDGNPWVKERLTAIRGYYDPAPRVVIVDFGSDGAHRQELERISYESGFEYVYVNDSGVFSLATARNIGAASATTELLFFNDIDCFGERDLIGRLASYANAIDLGGCFDQMINLPVYHLNEEATADFFDAEAPEERSRRLQRAFVDAVYTGRDEVAQFVDPSSNFFVCHRDYYDLVGGYNEGFRGHGSEDYEFLLRFMLYSGHLPLPDDPDEDHYGPTRDGFYGPKAYKGFRRLGELNAFHSEIAGLRIAHLFHGRPRDGADDGWYSQNDWKRRRFHEQIDPFLEQHHRLLGYDFMPRDKDLLVLLKHDWHYEFFVPLRLEGYRLHPLMAGDVDRYDEVLEAMDAGRFDAVSLFNPYMSSHKELRPFFELARNKGVRTIVVERGALPDSWYYAPDVSYNDPSWSEAGLDAEELSADELELAREYVTCLKSGSSTLEETGDMSRTVSRYAAFRRVYSKTCFVPLQLEDDMAVTRYTNGHCTYPEFRESVLELAGSRPDVLFLIKAHPLSKEELRIEADNVVLCTREDNVHGLIELADAVVCYNSGVGLLALLHGKAVVTVGNAFYNFSGLGKRAETFSEALTKAFDPAGFHERALDGFAAWILFRKYSFFTARSVYREFSSRRAHDYREMKMYHLTFDGRSRSYLRVRDQRPFDPSSYASGRLGVCVSQHAKDRTSHLAQAAPSNGSSLTHPRGDVVRRKLRKLGRDPKRFFADSRHAPLRWFGQTFIS